jgi:hypothetical protein
LQRLGATCSLTDEQNREVVVPAPGGDLKSHDDVRAREAAKAAVVRDGYKRVSIVDEAGNGAWRGTAYRDTTEVRLTVDSRGRVSLED